MTKQHSFAYEGKCAACKQEFAGCSFCRAPSYRGRGCSCPVEAIHISRHARFARRIAPKKTPAASDRLTTESPSGDPHCAAKADPSQLQQVES